MTENTETSLSEFPSDDRYRRVNLVGRGTYGSVYKAIGPSGSLCVLKQVPFDGENARAFQGIHMTAVREIKLLQSLSHQNIIQLQDVFASKDAYKNREKADLYLVFEYMDHDLKGLLRNKDIQLSPAQKKFYFHEILQGLKYLHQNGVLHRDIKASNILVNNRGHVKLTDFGLCRTKDPQSELVTNRVVTLWYRAPEILLGSDSYNESIDMWAIGCIFAELFTGEIVFAGETDPDVLERIFEVCGTPTRDIWPEMSKLPWIKLLTPKHVYSSSYDKVFKDMPSDARDLLVKLLQVNPQRRLSAEKALEHPYFQNEPQMIKREEHPVYAHSHEYTARKRSLVISGRASLVDPSQLVEQSRREPSQKSNISRKVLEAAGDHSSFSTRMHEERPRETWERRDTSREVSLSFSPRGKRERSHPTHRSEFISKRQRIREDSSVRDRDRDSYRYRSPRHSPREQERGYFPQRVPQSPQYRDRGRDRDRGRGRERDRGRGRERDRERGRGIDRGRGKGKGRGTDSGTTASRARYRKRKRRK